MPAAAWTWDEISKLISNYIQLSNLKKSNYYSLAKDIS